MKLQVNGTEHEVQEGLTLKDLLVTLGSGEAPVVVELNENALLPREYGQTLLHEGDRLEIIQITAGG